jgi:hypothetical protein
MGGIAGDGLWRSDRTRPSPRGDRRGPGCSRQPIPDPVSPHMTLPSVSGGTGGVGGPACAWSNRASATGPSLALTLA